MEGIQVFGNQADGFTFIPNSFIDRYMAAADGSYVKLYLLLLRCLSSDGEALTVSTLADRLECTEGDVRRALSFWQKKALLDLQTGADGRLTGIRILPTRESESSLAMAGENSVAAANERSTGLADVREVASEAPHRPLPEKKRYTPEQISSLAQDKDLELLLDILQQYMKGFLPKPHTDLVIHLYKELGFSCELILHLYEYCIEKDKSKPSYVESVAHAWAGQAIDTVEKAKEFSLRYNGAYGAVMKAFGLNNRLPAEAERRFIDKWLSYDFDVPIIVEACNRTILHTQKPDFKYTNGILENWRKHGIQTWEDIEQKDEEHQRQKAAKPAKAANRNTVKKPNGQFHNFPQRQYSSEDYSSLEQRLLHKTLNNEQEPSCL